MMQMRLSVPLVAACLFAADLQAQQSTTPGRRAASRVAAAVDSNSLRAHLDFLADDALEGRRPGTRGAELAAKYIAAQFSRLGLEPAGDSGTYYHQVRIITLTPTPTLKVLGASAPDLEYRKDYVLWSMRNEPVTAAKGDLVFVGYGIVAPEQGWNDYEGVDVKNKIVVALVNDPGLRDSTIFRGPILTYYGRWTYKIEEARRQGAAGILLVHTTESATYPWTTVQSGWTGPQVRIEEPPTSLLVAGWLSTEAASRLFQADGKNLDQLMEPGGNPAVSRRAAWGPGRRQRSQLDYPVGDQQCARPVAWQRVTGRRGRADHRPLRPLRDRHSHRWRLYLQRR